MNADGRVGSGAALRLAARAPGFNQLAGRRDLVSQGNEMAAFRRFLPVGVGRKRLKAAILSARDDEAACSYWLESEEARQVSWRASGTPKSLTIKNRTKRAPIGFARQFCRAETHR